MLQWSFSLRQIKVLVCIDNLGGSIYIEGRWMRQDNTFVELIATFNSAEQKGVAQYTAYLRTERLKRIKIRIKSGQDLGKIT